MSDPEDVRMGPAEWYAVRAHLGIPRDWTLRPKRHVGHWTLTATGGDPLPCGHRSMQVTAVALPLAVARMTARLRFHARYCR